MANHPRDGVVFLKAAARPGAPVEPWGGKSPRELTRVHELFILRAQASPATCSTREGGLYVVKGLSRLAEEGPDVYGGAPLLQPLKGRDHGTRKSRTHY